MEIMLLLLFILVLAVFLGLELISKIPSTLHTPLMSGANAISGITLVGALTLETGNTLQIVLAFCSITFASINVGGGYLVTNRMLRMFKKKWWILWYIFNTNNQRNIQTFTERKMDMFECAGFDVW